MWRQKQRLWYANHYEQSVGEEAAKASDIGICPYSVKYIRIEYCKRYWGSEHRSKQLKAYQFSNWTEEINFGTNRTPICLFHESLWRQSQLESYPQRHKRIAHFWRQKNHLKVSSCRRCRLPKQYKGPHKASQSGISIFRGRRNIELKFNKRRNDARDRVRIQGQELTVLPLEWLQKSLA